jgi:hypothetical protein
MGVVNIESAVRNLVEGQKSKVERFRNRPRGRKSKTIKSPKETLDGLLTLDVRLSTAVIEATALTTGYWSLVTGHWLLVTGYWSLATVFYVKVGYHPRVKSALLVPRRNLCLHPAPVPFYEHRLLKVPVRRLPFEAGSL